MKNSAPIKSILKVCKALLLPILVYVVFAILTNGRSTQWRVVFTTMRQSVTPILICYGIQLNMLVGMVNFSAGAAILTSCIIGGNFAIMTNTGIPGLIVFTVIFGVITGVVTGSLYKVMRVPCMVLTIGMMLVYEALPRILFKSGVNLGAQYLVLTLSPWCFIILGIMVVVFYVIYNLTPFGHNLRAVGANPGISNSVGIDIDKCKFLGFVVGGLFIGVAAVMYASSTGEVRNISAMGSMLIMMDGFMGMFMAMFISRYCNMTFAVPISVFTMKMISNGFVSLGMSATVRDITNGLILLVLLTISANQGKIERRNMDKAFAIEANKKRLCI